MSYAFYCRDFYYGGGGGRSPPQPGFRSYFVAPASRLASVLCDEVVVALFARRFGLVSRSFCGSLVSSLRFRHLAYPYNGSNYLAVRKCCSHEVGASRKGIGLRVYHILYSSYKRARTLLPSSVIPCSRISLTSRAAVVGTCRSRRPATRILRSLSSISVSSIQCVIQRCHER